MDEVEKLLERRRQAFGELFAMGVTGDVLRRLRELGAARLRQMEDRHLELYRTEFEGRRTYARASDLAGALAHVERIEAAIAEARAARSRLYRSRPRRRRA